MLVNRRDDRYAIRTIPQIVPGLLSSLLEAHRCKPAKHGAFGAARPVLMNVTVSFRLR